MNWPLRWGLAATISYQNGATLLTDLLHFPQNTVTFVLTMRPQISVFFQIAYLIYPVPAVLRS
jgi:hypothetical protein